MQVAVISDIHENFHNLIRSLEKMEELGVEYILCLGDLMNPGIAKVLATQSIPVFLIWGNNDGDKVEITLASKAQNSVMSVSPRTYDFIELGGRNIFLTHYNDLAEPMAKTGLYDAVFFGHNHDKHISKVGDCWLVNPGEIAASKTKTAAMAIYNTESNDVELITLENTIHLKSELMEEYFKKHAHKMNLRSKLLDPKERK